VSSAEQVQGTEIGGGIDMEKKKKRGLKEAHRKKGNLKGRRVKVFIFRPNPFPVRGGMKDGSHEGKSPLLNCKSRGLYPCGGRGGNGSQSLSEIGRFLRKHLHSLRYPPSGIM